MRLCIKISYLYIYICIYIYVRMYIIPDVAELSTLMAYGHDMTNCSRTGNTATTQTAALLGTVFSWGWRAFGMSQSTS